MRTKLKLFTKFLCVLVACMLIFPMLFGAKTVRADGEQITGGKIVVFSVEDYIDDSIFDDFKAKTGIEVKYLTFATNEAMYNELKKSPSSVDLICPSEYMIMKMISEGLIREFDVPFNQKKYGSKYINQIFRGLKVENKQGEVVSIMSEDENKTYAVGYMWGTIGLIYNKNLPNGQTLTDADFENWSVIWDNFKGRITIKDSIRDSYFLALAYVYQDELLTAKKLYNQTGDSQEYSQTLAEIFNRTDQETVDKVEEALLALKKNLYGFEVDAGKSDILTGKIDVNFAWSGDAVYSIQQGLFDEDGNYLDNPVYLGYAVPQEGSNVWFDGYVMTKDADYERAIKFLDFLCDPEVAVKNMDYTGYTSCIAGDSCNTAVFDYVLDSYGASDEESGATIDLAYFFDPSNTTGDYSITVSDTLLAMFNAQYPSQEVISRCAVMQNFTDEQLQRINNMWNRVKLTTLSDAAIVIIICAIALVVLAVVLIKYREKIFGKMQFSKQTDKNKKYQVVKREKI